jgi:rhomboid protease GluP
LDPHLDQLRMNGLIRLTDWVAGLGQGYALTPAGEEVLRSPRQLARLLAGKWTPRVEGRDNRRTSAAPSPWERGERIREALLYPVQPVLTFVLISICVGIFLVRYLSKDYYRQIEEFAVLNPFDLLRHQWWRLLTTTFLHGGELHLACNMYALFALGQGAERIWGRWRFFLIYMIAGFGGSCLAMTLQPVACVGASGAICGIFAGEAAWFYFNRHYFDRRLFFSWQRNFLINLVLLVFISFFPGVSWSAHLGGAITGFLVALCLSYAQVQIGWRRWLALLAVVLVPVLSFGMMQRAMQTTNEWVTFQRRVEKEETRIRNVQEIREFEKKYLPAIESSSQTAKKVFEADKVDEILEKNPKRRRDETGKATADLKASIDSLNKTADDLRNAGRYTDPIVEEAKTAGLKHLETQGAYLQLVLECLQKGENWTEKDEAKLQQQKEDMEKADQKWQGLLTTR